MIFLFKSTNSHSGFYFSTFFNHYKKFNMKKLFLFGIAAVVITLESCSNSSSSSTASDSAGKNSSDTSAAMGKDTTAASGGNTADAASSDFAMKAANGGMAEVAAGKMAVQKASSQRVKDFAAMMVSDHSKANDELKQKATSQNITLPASIADDDQKMLDKLNMKSGKDFDKAYMDMMLSDHKKTIALFQTEASSGTNAVLKDFATATLPTLQKHLTAVQSITGNK